jgi:hypothetical protein
MQKVEQHRTIHTELSASGCPEWLSTATEETTR